MPTLPNESHTSQQNRWPDWKWQLRHRIKDASSLQPYFQPTPEEEQAISNASFPFAITPYYASLIDASDPRDPLRRAIIPSIAEQYLGSMAQADPCEEDAHEVVPRLVHRYPDRALLLPTSECPVYCRYCTRSRWVGSTAPPINEDSLLNATQYLREHSEIRDVLISGGDPLLLSDQRISHILSSLSRIPSIDIIRIGTKTATALPMRFTDNLVSILRNFQPLWLQLHFCHPQELTAEVIAACKKLADAGVPLTAQVVLLRGVNNDTSILQLLFRRLIQLRVRPYYLYQCDPVPNAMHFRTSVQSGLTIMKQLQGRTTGFAIPTYVIDAPNGGGKIPLQSSYITSISDSEVVLRNYEDLPYIYPNTNID
ncbi:KamA family protein (plasmid) [Thioflavicoccus mobilis 8321]|uniref:KamA family protein n=1 Tax=Thioflavicoccus mobilis 8321 TaxID=765912 RepID=L0H438_9GAMM|nr:KamA family radical SAM protein [Thioflavicoccus mobilis]AGA92364.1 KamA family protein [Thioflavicoccus mobilis 8321]